MDPSEPLARRRAQLVGRPQDASARHTDMAGAGATAGSTPVAVEPAAQVGQRTSRTRPVVLRLVLCAYLVIAVVLTWRLWANPSGRIPGTGSVVENDDILLSAWFMRYSAAAIAHGSLPALVTKALNWPQGVNVMWNTSLLLPGVILTPVTLLLGPFVSLTLLVTLGFAGSAATMFFVLRRWGVSPAAAALGGAVYGFSPALVEAAQDHYHLQFAVLPPLILDAALGLLTGRGADKELPGRRAALRVAGRGAWLGLLIAAQLFIAEELLVDTGLAGLVMAVVLVASRPKVLTRLRTVGVAAAGLAVGAGVALVLCVHAVLVQFHGPLAEIGSPWPLGRYGNRPSDFVTAPAAMIIHGAGFRTFLVSTGQTPQEYFAYLGWPLLVALVAAVIWCWRDLRVRVAGLCWAVLEVCSVGGHSAQFGPWHLTATVLPWHWLERLPLLSQLLPNRLSIIADGAAAVVLACAIDRAWAAMPTARGRLQAHWLRSSWLREHWPQLAGPAVAALILVPTLPRPVPATALAPLPYRWDQVIAGLHLRPGEPVLVIPMNAALTLQYQAQTGVPSALVGGYCIVPAPNKHAAECDTFKTLNSEQQTTLLRLNLLAGGLPLSTGPSRVTMTRALQAWLPAAVVTASADHSPLQRYLLGYFGPPTLRFGSTIGWRLPRTPGEIAARYSHYRGS